MPGIITPGIILGAPASLWRFVREWRWCNVDVFTLCQRVLWAERLKCKLAHPVTPRLPAACCGVLRPARGLPYRAGPVAQRTTAAASKRLSAKMWAWLKRAPLHTQNTGRSASAEQGFAGFCWPCAASGWESLSHTGRCGAAHTIRHNGGSRRLRAPVGMPVTTIGQP